MTRSIRVVDSHTGGEPTRLVISGGPDLRGGSVAERLQCFRADHDAFRAAIVNEPRGSDVMVGGLIVEPQDPTSAAGVIFFNNVGYLGMCGHGTIGLITTLAHLGRIAPGEHRIETSVGVVTARLHESGQVSVKNVSSFRDAKNVRVPVPGFGFVTGDIAWGGNWFFLVTECEFDKPLPSLDIQHVEELTALAWAIRQSLTTALITGRDGGEIDHIELFAPTPTADSRNFVLCPGKAWDRSPCGTGTSAKLACLYADGKLAEGAIWRQESIIGSVFEGSVEPLGDGPVIPTITGSAWVTAESNLILNPADPFCWGIPS